jgi:hypothetical protein
MSSTNRLTITAIGFWGGGRLGAAKVLEPCGLLIRRAGFETLAAHCISLLTSPLLHAIGWVIRPLGTIWAQSPSNDRSPRGLTPGRFQNWKSDTLRESSAEPMSIST